MTAIIVIATCISAIATGVIAYYAIVTHVLTTKIQSRDDEFRQQIGDLYKAIVISNLMVAKGLGPPDTVGSTWDYKIIEFNGIYEGPAKGKTTIFE